MVPPGQCLLMTSCSNSLGMCQNYVESSPCGPWDHSVFVSWPPGRQYPVWLPLRLQMVELLVCSITSMSSTDFKIIDSLLTMATTNSIISFLGTLAVASSLSEIASIYPTAGGLRAPIAPLEHSAAKCFRTVSLGCGPGPRLFAVCCVMVHWLDLNRRSDRFECFCCIRRRFTVSRPDHS